MCIWNGVLAEQQSEILKMAACLNVFCENVSSQRSFHASLTISFVLMALVGVVWQMFASVLLDFLIFGEITAAELGDYLKSGLKPSMVNQDSRLMIHCVILSEWTHRNHLIVCFDFVSFHSYYRGIRQMVPVSDQDMNTHLAEVSRVWTNLCLCFVACFIPLQCMCK